MGARRKTRFLLYGLGAAVVLAIGLWGLLSYQGADDVVLLAGKAGSQKPGTGSGAASIDLSWDPAESTSTTVPLIYVQLTGAVRDPGVHSVPKGSRLFQVFEKAGGLEADAETDSLALAAVVADGARIHVPRKGEVAEGQSPAVASGGGASPGPISLSTASIEQLDSLPGVGPALAAAIVSYREEHGGFSSVEELDQVSGIGPALVAKLRDLVVP